MPDGEDYRIPVVADVSSVITGFGQIAEAADRTGAAVVEAFSGAEPAIHDFADAANQSAYSAQEAAAAMQDWREATGLAAEGNAELATSTAEVIAEMDGSAEAARAAAAAQAEAAAEQVASMREVEGQAEKSTMTLRGVQSAFWEIWTASFAFSMVSGIVKDLTKTQSDLANEMQRTAQIMGTSNQEARAWIDAAELSGVAANSFTTASRTMNSEVAAGGKHLKEMGISLRDQDGAMKTTGQLIEETIQKLETYSASADRNALAQKTLGRGWIDLVANGQQLIANLKQQEQELAGTGAAQDAVVAQGKALEAINAQIAQSWRNIVEASGPALIGLLKAVEQALQNVAASAQVAMVAIEGVFKVASGLGALQKGLSDAYVPEGGALGADQAQVKQGLDEINDATKSLGDTYADVSRKIDDISKKRLESQRQLWVDHMAMYRPNQGFEGEYAGGGPSLTAAPPAELPKGGGGGRHRGGGGGADPMAGLDNALDMSNDKMAKLNEEFQKLGSESAMAAKEGGQSYDQLAAKAAQDFQVMQQKYREFTDAVQSGSKQPAQESDKAWHQAAQDFQKDWDQAKQKAQQDMQQIKSTADQISGEISGVLNSAISGKLNWQQEFAKILEKMLDMLIKYLAEMLAKWIATHAAVNTATAVAGAQSLGIQQSIHAATAPSDAASAAQGAYASASHIPYIGWIVGPIAAAAAFAGVEAYGSAEGGYDVPLGVNPIMQLHQNEMVLPANLAAGVRDMTEGGGRGGPTNINVTSNVNALDPRGISDIIDGAHASIAKAAAKFHRSGGRFYRG